MDNSQASTNEELWSWIEEFFFRMENQKTYFQHLIDSMPERLARVLQTDGDYTSY